MRDCIIFKTSFFYILIISLLLFNCSKDNSTVSDTSEEIVSNVNDSESEISNSESESLTTNIGEGVPSVFSKIYGATDIYIEDSNIVIKVDGVPDHKSPYFNASDDMYEDYNGSNLNFDLNPNKIRDFDFVYKIPLNPRKSNKSNPTPLGSIGVSLNGVSFFNQYAGPNNQPLTNEINSFDQYNGHPQPQGVYHYHIEPIYLTEKVGSNSLLGFLLDGFPVYGPEESGSKITNDDLDEFHGHSHPTVDFPDGIYHYHITDKDPYINGSGYYGSPGTVTN